jgi:hypothetical protein
MNTQTTTSWNINEFVNVIKNTNSIKPLYSNSCAEFEVDDDVIRIVRPNVESSYSLFKRKDENWVPYYENDNIFIEETKYGVIMLTVVADDVIILTEDFSKEGHTHVPEDIDKLYDWIAKGDVFNNVMLGECDDYIIKINNKLYKEINVLDYEADEEAGEIQLTICDIESVDIQCDYANVVYRIDSETTNTLTLTYKEK